MPTSSISSTLLRDLGAIVGPAGLVVDPVALAVYENDAYTLERCRPGCVGLPRSTDEVKVALGSAEAGVTYEAGKSDAVRLSR